MANLDELFSLSCLMKRLDLANSVRSPVERSPFAFFSSFLASLGERYSMVSGASACLLRRCLSALDELSFTIQRVAVQA